MSDDTSIKVPVFDGNSKNFMMWWVRFKAFAVMKNFSRALTEDAALPAEESTVPADDDAKLAKKANETAMASLTMAFKTDAMLNIILRSMTTKWPGGLAHKVSQSSRNSFSLKI